MIGANEAPSRVEKVIKKSLKVRIGLTEMKVCIGLLERPILITILTSTLLMMR